MNTINDVTRVPAASPRATIEHHEGLLAFETDCWDVHAALESGAPGFVLLDVRSEALFLRGHVPGARHLPRR